MAPNIQFMLRALYELKRDYGVPAVLIQVLQEETDSAKGVRSVLRDVVKINKVVPFSETSIKKFWYDIGYLRANSNFTYGGEVQIQTRQIVLQKKDIGKRTITTSDFFILEGIRYQVEKVYDLDFQIGYLISLKTAEGMPAASVIFVRAHNNLQISGGCVNDP
jgi:hypothetical protein